MRKYRIDAILFGIFLAIVAVFFYPTILQGKLPIPSDSLVGLYHPWRDALSQEFPRGVPFKNFLITDPVRQQIPWRAAVMEQWKKFRLPLWNPYNFSGMPLAANIQAAAFYPLNIIFLIPDFPAAWSLLIMLQPILAGVFLYLYLRTIGLRRIACLFGAISWSFCGFAIAWMTWGTIVHAALWLPFILFCIEKLFEKTKKPLKKNLLWSGALALGLLSGFFAGHAQVAFYMLIVSVSYAFWKLQQEKKSKAEGYIASAFILFGIVGAIQWVPMVRLLTSSGRLEETANWLKDGWFIPWQNLVQFIVPDFFGNPTTMNYWGVWNYGEFVGYIGILPLLFALYALLSWKESQVRFWAVIGGLALVFAVPNPLSRLPYQLGIPLLSTLQPTRLLVVADLALVVLAAWGLNTWMRAKDKRIVWILAALAVVILGSWGLVLSGNTLVHDALFRDNLLVTKRNLVLPTILLFVSGFGVGLGFVLRRKENIPRVVITGIILLTAFDLLRFGWKFTPFTPRSYFFPETQVMKFLMRQKGQFRIMSLDSRILPPDVSSWFQLESAEGYDPIYLSRYGEYIAASERGKPDTTPPFGFNRIITPHNIDSPLVPLLGVRYVLSLNEISRPFLKKVFEEGETRVYEDTRGLPRAYLVEKVLGVVGKGNVLMALFDPELDPKTTAVIEGPAVPLVSVPLETGEGVDILASSPGLLTLRVRAAMPRFLVITNSYYPAWQAMLDGKSATLHRTNYLFQGIAIPVGDHTVTLRYRWGL